MCVVNRFVEPGVKNYVGKINISYTWTLNLGNNILYFYTLDRTNDKNWQYSFIKYKHVGQGVCK